MQPRQTPKWLELFITAFGGHGLVALAWWLGALHAERIRSAQRSFPFLELIGGTGSGQADLMRVLCLLIGKDHAPRGSTIAPWHQLQADSGPVVIEEAEGCVTPFDWDELKPLFSGGPVRFGGTSNPGEAQAFRGALVVLANPPMADSLRSRFVFVEPHHSEHPEASAQALRDLLDMLSTGGVDFLDTANAAGDRLGGLLQHMTTAYLISEPHHNKRVAMNHAQLHALVGVLDDLFVLPTDAREDAHIEIAAMTLITD